MHPTDSSSSSWDTPAGNPLEDLLRARELGLGLEPLEPYVEYISPQEWQRRIMLDRERRQLAHLTEVAQSAVDRHTRAVAQAQAAGITGLRDVWTASA